MKKKLVLFAGIYHTGIRKYVEFKQRVVSPGGIYTGKKAGNAGEISGGRRRSFGTCFQGKLSLCMDHTNAAVGSAGMTFIGRSSISPKLVALPAGIFSMAINSVWAVNSAYSPLGR